MGVQLKEKASLGSLSSRNLSSHIFYGVEHADRPQILLILQIEASITPHVRFQTIHHSAAVCAVFFPAENQNWCHLESVSCRPSCHHRDSSL